MTNREIRWYGWGYADTTFSFENRLAGWGYLKEQLGMTEEVHSLHVELDAIPLRPSRLTDSMLSALHGIVGEDSVVISNAFRITHSLGKSYRDIINLRGGVIPNPTDAVIFPGTDEQILSLLAFCAESGPAIIPFGGGTSVVGGVEPIGDQPSITLSLARMNRVHSIDPISQTVTAEAGIPGPDLEAALNEKGFTLNHFPQSFEFSTLGGWIATRSAGHSSTKYGKIEDMLVSVRMITPKGMIETQNVPASAAGPSMLQMLAGSEGAFGVITQATLRIRPVPKFRREFAWLFRDFQTGVDAVRKIMQTGLSPALARLSDEEETRTTFWLRESRSGWPGLRQKITLTTLERMGGSFEKGAVLLLAFEGEDECALHEADHAKMICKEKKALHLGAGPVRSWWKDRFHTPYLRDVLIERGLLVDTLETATEWNNVEVLHKKIQAALSETVARMGSKALVLTHLSHIYRDGASLYVTLLAKSSPGHELEQWQVIKDRVTDCIVQHGGALSHHHGIGYEHAKWLAQAEGQTGLEVLHAVKRSLDPKEIMNPGKLLERRLDFHPANSNSPTDPSTSPPSP